MKTHQEKQYGADHFMEIVMHWYLFQTDPILYVWQEVEEEKNL